MGSDDSLLDAAELARARDLLTCRERPERTWPALTAASLLALSAIGFAAAMVLAPPLNVEHVAATAPR